MTVILPQLLCHTLAFFILLMRSSVPSLAAAYEPVPRGLKLKAVLVVHRHGDRAQIAQGLGTNYPRNEHITKIWQESLPAGETLRRMAISAAPQPPPESTGDSPRLTSHKSLYYGWDRVNYPYAQLTEVGAQQMICVGKEMRARYSGSSGSLLSLDKREIWQSLYCRSTPMCRTGQSLRSLLVGLCDIHAESADRLDRSEERKLLPQIRIRNHDRETQYPPKESAAAMAVRRGVVHPPSLSDQRFPYFTALETELKAKLGIKGKLNWEMVMEVLHCHHVHGIKYVLDDLPDNVLAMVTEIAGWNWGVLYKDPVLNRMAIGRFIYDLMADLKTALGEDAPKCIAQSRVRSSDPIEMAAARDKKLLIYSGHDSTLVPVLCALGLYDDEWPPYASHLALEVAQSMDAPEAHFVRAVYNNRELCMFNDEAPAWFPLEEFWRRLESVACSQAEFEELCRSVVAGERAKAADNAEADEGGDGAAMTAKEVEEEIAATTSGSSGKQR